MLLKASNLIDSSLGALLSGIRKPVIPAHKVNCEAREGSLGWAGILEFRYKLWIIFCETVSDVY
jgi:hypothetical protein